jgi:hypothetical protein
MVIAMRGDPLLSELLASLPSLSYLLDRRLQQCHHILFQASLLVLIHPSNLPRVVLLGMHHLLAMQVLQFHGDPLFLLLMLLMLLPLLLVQPCIILL